IEFPGADSPARLDFSPDSHRLAAIDASLNLALYDLQQSKRISLAGLPTELWAVKFDPTGELLAASHAETIMIIDALSGKVAGVEMKHPGSEVRGLAWHPDGRHLVSVCADRLVCLWDRRTGESIRTLKGHDREAMSVAFNHSGNLLASAGWD